MNNPKRILKINSIYKSIKKNKLLWDKFNHERKRRLHWKPTKHYFKKLKGTWTNGKTLHVHGLKDLMLLRWRYYIEEAIDPVPSLSKSLWCVLFVCFAVVVVVVYQNRKTHQKNPTQLTFVPAVSPPGMLLHQSHPLQKECHPRSHVTCLLVVALPHHPCIPDHLLFVLFFFIALNIICPSCVFYSFIFWLLFLNINGTRSWILVCLFTIFWASRTCQACGRCSR